MYYIKTNKKKGEFGAFAGIYCKKRYMGEVEENKELEAEYPGGEFCYGFTKGKIMIIGAKGVEKIIKR
ncbi:hypothetical protein LR004_00255 [Candidatus Gracilibacteria bacterium]|nr:hypothetical protein [Candidatus Gracilibacteria bacterium]